MKEANICLTHEEIERRLADAGVQPTAQRIAICRYVLCEADHPTADQVKAWADENFPKMSLATVYNTLNTLVEAKLLKEFKFPHSEKAVYDNNVEKHFHFFDEKTGEITDIMPDQVEIQFKGKKFKVNEMEIIFKGTKIK
jgi:Fur family iron response transcriptional regulator